MMYEVIYDIIPTVNALNDANSLDDSGFYNDRGRVPLFYAEEFEIDPESKEGGNNRVPLFLETKDLFREFKKKYPERKNLTVTVVDLNELFSAMVGNLRGFDDRLMSGDVYLVPTIESRKKAVELEKDRGDRIAFKVGEMFAVSATT